ncbi:MAG: serine/threonine-protein kinase [Myxococcota bacterium]|nr:serine/threonine-protein kinase [Myxococcota bacterium]
MSVELSGLEAGGRDFPERLGRYRLVRRISRGGMAQVYEARRESLAGVAPRVALKVILPEHAEDENFRDLFINEARVGSQLQHPNLVQIQDFDQQGDLYYLVMEYVEGVTLRRMLSLSKRNGLALSQAVIAEMGRQICEGLHYAHTARAEDGAPRHLVHRDIKPGNVILNPQGVVKILDFGISKVLDAADGQDGVKGTWGYMSPEQAAGGAISGAADQFGLASVLYELAALQRLYGETDQKKIRELMRRDEGARRTAQLGGNYRDLGPVLMRALQRDPAARYPTAIGMGRSLARLIGDPVLIREKLVELQSTYSRLDKSRSPAPEPVRSQATLSRSPGSKPYQSGIPVSVGNAHRPMKPVEIDPGTRPTSGEGADLRNTINLAALGVSLLILAFVLLHLFSTSDAPQEEASLLEVPAETIGQDSPLEPRTPATAAPVKSEPASSPAAQPEPPPTKAEAPKPTKRKKPTPPKKPKPRADVTPTPVRSSPPKPRPPEPVEMASGKVTISSLPRSRVSIDGVFLRYTPLLSHEVPSGSHMVVLETDDDRRIQFRLDVKTGEEVRRIWDFEQGLWRDP